MNTKKTIDYREDYYRGLVKSYFTRILKILIEWGDLQNEHGLILDFGCGHGHLKKLLPDGSHIIGYDIIPELTEISDYRNLKPELIVLSGVMEHLAPEEIESLLKDFVTMNPKAKLLVFLPTENCISKGAMFISGIRNAHADHVTGYRRINAIVEKYYHIGKRTYRFFRMAQITKYLPKEKELNAEAG